MQQTEFTRSEREALKAIYRFTRDGSEAHTGTLADRLGLSPGTVTTLVKRLADERLIVTSQDLASDEDQVEVAHEALIRHWPRLRGWLDEDRQSLRLREGVLRVECRVAKSRNGRGLSSSSSA